MVACGIVHADEPGIVGKDRGGNVVDLAADEPAHRHVELQVHDLDVLAAEERRAGDVLLCRPGPRRQEVRHERLARGLLLGLRHADGRRDDRSQGLDVLHHAFVACRLEVVGGMQAVAAADQHEDGVGVGQRRLSGQLEDRQAAVGRLLLHRGPVGALDANVVEFDARQVQCEAAFFAATHRRVEVDKPGLGHAIPPGNGAHAGPGGAQPTPTPAIGAGPYSPSPAPSWHSAFHWRRAGGTPCKAWTAEPS